MDSKAVALVAVLLAGCLVGACGGSNNDEQDQARLEPSSGSKNVASVFSHELEKTPYRVDYVPLSEEGATGRSKMIRGFLVHPDGTRMGFVFQPSKGSKDIRRFTPGTSPAAAYDWGFITNAGNYSYDIHPPGKSKRDYSSRIEMFLAARAAFCKESLGHVCPP